MGRHRIFAGCPVPARAAEEMEASASANLPGARVLPAASLHATLFFFGWRNEEEVATLLNAFNWTEWKPLPVEVTGIRRFGRTAISFLFSADLGELFSSRAFLKLSEMAGKGGRVPRLHITIARSRDLKKLLRSVPAFSFSLDIFCLYESALGKSVPDYRVLASTGK